MSVSMIKTSSVSAPAETMTSTGTAHADTGHASPTAFGLDATVWVSLSMAVLLTVLVVKKVPAAVGRMLDGRIAAIRTELDEAKALRRDAEALRAEYEAKLAAADAERDTMRIRAETEAAEILAKAERDGDALVARRQKMAQDRIAAAEASALADVRAAAAEAASKAARTLIRERHDAATDRPLVDKVITGLTPR